MIAAAILAGLAACQNTPEPTLTPRPTATKPVLLPTPTLVVASQVEGTLVGTVAPTPVLIGLATSAPPTSTTPVLTTSPGVTATVKATSTLAPAASPTPGATPTRAHTPVPGATNTATPTQTYTPLPGATPTPTPTKTNTPAPTFTPPATSTSAPTNTPVASTRGDSIFGVELATFNTAGGLPQAKTLGARWLRRNALLWASVETSEGARNWSAIAELEQELRDASAQGFEVILIVRSAPGWAQKNPGQQCGPVLPSKYAAFGAFLRDAVARYSVAPFNVKYWEIWNEPDADPSLFAGNPNTEFGCLGDQTDEFYGGGAYGELLKAVYPQLKQANPAAQMLVGGLLLDCDPVNPPAGKTCTPSKFLEGALRAGAGAFFDGVSYHGYDYYGGLEKFSNSNWGAAWNTTGPVSIVKARFIKNALAQYGATGKFLINTESAVIGFGMTKTNDDFEYTKAIYAVKAYALGMAEGLRANIWYSMKGWLLSGLVDDTMVPHQAYKTIQFLIPKLQNATFTAERASAPGVKVYEFNNQGRLILIAWSADGATRNLTLEAVPAAVYDVTGVALGRTQNQSVTSAPIIVELN